jgi:hypothetical protein
MIYEYMCRTCGHRHLSKVQANDVGPCVNTTCDGTLKRKYSLSIHRPMPDHFNATTGQMVGSMREFDDQLKRKSEEYTLRTGIEAKFVSHDPSEAKALGVTGEGLSETKRDALGL